MDGAYFNRCECVGHMTNPVMGCTESIVLLSATEWNPFSVKNGSSGWHAHKNKRVGRKKKRNNFFIVVCFFRVTATKVPKKNRIMK
jgi:hypothetical protein